MKSVHFALSGVASLLWFLTGLSPASSFAQASGLPPAPGEVGKAYRDPASGRIRARPPKMEIHVCPATAQEAACETTSLSKALETIRPGGTVVLHPGLYRQAAYIRRPGTRMRGLSGARLVGASIGGKGALVVQADNVVIEGLACSNISVSDGNGACIRQEAKNLTLRRVHFFDSEQGVLTGGSPGLVLIEDSRFENLGRGGQAHGIYIGGGELVVRRSIFISSKDEGHEIKSRAARTLIEDSVIASLNSADSYLIDVPNGGVATIRRNILQEGPASANHTAISFGMEGIRHHDSRIRVQNNLIFMDRHNSVTVKVRGSRASFAGNVVVGNPRSYSLGDVNASCGEAENICVTSRNRIKHNSHLPMPRIEGLPRILHEFGLMPARK